MRESLPRRGRTYFKGWRLGCLGMAVGLWLVVAVIIGGCSVLLLTGSGPPTLPPWAYPQGSGVVRTDAFDSDCGGAGGGLPCQRVVFRATTDSGEWREALIKEFDRRGWSVHYSRTDDGVAHGLSARSEAEDTCILYSEYERPGTAAGLQRPFVIDVHVTNCSDIKY